MKYFTWFNVICFVALVLLSVYKGGQEISPIDGFYKRKEIIITKGEDRIELTTNADFLAQERKYTSIVNVTDVDNENQFSSFSIDGDFYSKNGLIYSKTNKVEETDTVNKPVVFTASTSPIVSQIQKSLLGVDVYNARRYEYFQVEEYFCYFDVDKKFARCMK